MTRDSRRARVLLTVLVLVGTALLLLDSRGAAEPVSSVTRAAGAAVFTPISSMVSTASAPAVGVYRTLTAAPNARERITELEEENTELTRLVQAHDRDSERAKRLDELLGLSGLDGYEIVPAHAVTRVTAQGYTDTITLDVGQRDGIVADMTVVDADGLVGRVVEVTERSASVLLVTDSASSVGVRMEDTGEIGVVSGRARNLSDPEGNSLHLELLDATAAVQPGERLVSLGSHGSAPFVPGVTVGTVKSVTENPGTLSRTARVRPAVNVSQLDIVGVVVGEPDHPPRDPVPPEGDMRDQASAPAPHQRHAPGGGARS